MAKKKKKVGGKGMDVILVLGIVFILFVGFYIILKHRNLSSSEDSEKLSLHTRLRVSKTGGFSRQFFISDKFSGKEAEPKLAVKNESKSENIIARKPAVAGSFYPKDRDELERAVDGFLEKAEDVRLPNVRGLVAPHAGYVYSGLTAAYDFKQLVGRDITTVIVLAPSHYVRLKDASVLDVTHFETPLGLIKVSPKVKELLKEDGFANIPSAHAQEHSLEVELPFLQRTLGDFELIPVVVGDADPKALASVLAKYVDDKTLVVASSDLSHYYPYAEAVKLDSACTSAIPLLDFEGMKSCQACGSIPIQILMLIAEERGWVGKLLDYRNSGDTAGDKSRVVGYSSVAFFDGLTPGEEDVLLKLARDTLNQYYEDGSRPEIEENALTPKMKKLSGCFVTLNKNGDLRGCVGHILPQVPLYECVIENALNAALHDTRFNPVAKDEVPDLHIDVSVLTLPEKMTYSSPDDLLRKLVPGRDGVVLKVRGRQSTYLPQVWEQLPDKEEFLTSLCRKQGSSGDCWKSGAEVEVYRAQVFEEKE